MDKAVCETVDTGSSNSSERLPFWAVVVFYLFRFSIYWCLLSLLLDIDSVEDLMFNGFVFLRALPFLCAPVFLDLWQFFSDCHGFCQRGYCARNKRSPSRKWFWGIVVPIGCLLICWLVVTEHGKGAGISKETVDGVTWRYKTVDGNAVIERRHPQFCAAISVSTTGELKIPSTLGGHPVTGIGEYAFYKCSKLTSVVIPKSVTNIARCAFEECGGLKSIEIPESVKTLGYSAFGSCSRLTTVKLRGKFCPAWGAPFISCRALTAFEVDPDNESCKVVDGMLLSKDGTCLWVGVNGDVEIPNGVTKIDCKAFSGRELKSVAMPRTVTDIGEAAFENCRGLKSVVLPEGVTGIGFEAFHGCDGLTSVTIPEGVNGIGAWAFSGCRGLTSVVLPESVKIIGNDAFRGCSNLASIVVPSNVVHIMQSAFAETPFFDNKPEGLVVLSGIAYRWKGKRSDVLIPDGVTRIIENAFENRYDFKSVAVADSVTNVGYAAFRGCTGLTSVTLGNRVASIENGAFYACFKLSSVSIPRSLTSVGQDAFRGCPIKTIYVEKGDADRVRELLRGKGVDVDKVEFVERDDALPFSHSGKVDCGPRRPVELEYEKEKQHED